MKKLLFCSILGVITLSSFTSTKKENAKLLVDRWVVTCADGSYGGQFACNCNQSQANAIAAIMCK